MRRVILGAVLALAASPALAQIYVPRQPAAPSTTRSYDWQSGNSYTTRRNSDGSSATNGYNVQNGSMWNSRTQSDGRTTGTDSKGNIWSYNPRSGSYISSDGTVCTGQGAARVCN